MAKAVQQSLSRVDLAKHVLSGLGREKLELEKAVWKRLRGEPQDIDLPGLARDEDPADIFLHVVKYTNERSLADLLRGACAHLLEAALQSPHLEQDAVAIGELCYLSARIGASDAIEPLTVLVERKETSSFTVRTGEDLRLRALRSLVGLLASNRQRVDTQRHRRLFEECLRLPRYKKMALTGLVGLWPELKDEFVRDLSGDEARALKTSLAIAGYGSPSIVP